MKHQITIVICIISLAIRTGWSQTATNTEKRSAIVEAEGFAFLGEDKTLRQMREEALTNAKSEALARAETFIQSVTKVENFMLKYDLVQSTAEGTVRIIESKDEGIMPDNRYRYWIKAEVQYQLMKPKESSQNENPVQIAAAPLEVNFWTDKNEYEIGDEIHIYLKSNKDCYATIVYQDASGHLFQILPNQHRQMNLFTADRIWEIPAETDRFRLIVEPPCGPEKIIVYASTVEVGKGEIIPDGESFYRLQTSLETFSTKTRGVRIEKADQAAEFYETSSELLTKENHD